MARSRIAGRFLDPYRRLGPIPRLVSAVGGLFLVIAVARAVFKLRGGGSLLEAFIDFILIGVPSVVLMYTGYWMPGSEIERRYYPRMIAWLLGGIVVMFGFIFLRDLHPGVTVEWSLGTQAIALTIGSIGGLLIGIQETQASMRKDQLERQTEALEQRTMELLHREEELERQNDQLEEFASIISHDLRNPLSVAKGRLELAREECDSDHLDHVDSAHDRMDSLIGDLLTLAREGNAVGNQEPVDVEHLARNCWENVETADASLSIDSVSRVTADGERLKQLLENLMRNAVEHGGDDVTVRIGDLPGGRGIFLEDDGSGLPDSDGEQFLERGFSTTSDGTGLGLAIVRDIASAHGWEIRTGASEADGARFEIHGMEHGTGPR